MARKNVVMLMGNHEQMCLDTLGKNNVYGARQLWSSNGGSVTRRELLYHMDARRRNAILNFLASLPDKLDMEVNGRRFHLVHGCPGTSHDSRIWERPSLDMPNPFPDGRTIIVGHTPVCFLLYPDCLLYTSLVVYPDGAHPGGWPLVQKLCQRPVHLLVQPAKAGG